MVVGMSFHSLPTEEPVNTLDQAPLEVRQALLRMQRAARALGVYRRRGWSLSHVESAHRRARAEFHAAVDRWEQDELNPRLF